MSKILRAAVYMTSVSYWDDPPSDVERDMLREMAVEARAEYDKLRAQVAELMRERDAAYAQDHKRQDAACAAGQRDERASVIEYLCRLAHAEKATLYKYAMAIERGEHL